MTPATPDLMAIAPEHLAKLFTLMTVLEIRMARIEDAITALRIDLAPAPPE